MLVPVCWLDKIKQTCNKAFPQTRQQYLQQHKYTVITYLIILPQTKKKEVYTNTVMKSFILCGYVKNSAFQPLLWDFIGAQ